jgi:hypothetical protein
MQKNTSPQRKTNQKTTVSKQSTQIITPNHTVSGVDVTYLEHCNETAISDQPLPFRSRCHHAPHTKPIHDRKLNLWNPHYCTLHTSTRNSKHTKLSHPFRSRLPFTTYKQPKRTFWMRAYCERHSRNYASSSSVVFVRFFLFTSTVCRPCFLNHCFNELWALSFQTRQNTPLSGFIISTVHFVKHPFNILILESHHISEFTPSPPHTSTSNVQCTATRVCHTGIYCTLYTVHCTHTALYWRTGTLVLLVLQYTGVD